MEQEETTVEESTVLAKLREKHGEIAYWKVPGHGLVVAANPENAAEYDRLVNTLKKDDADASAALRTFAQRCVVHPEPEQVRAIFKARPAFALKVAARGQQLAGAGIEELGKD